MFPRKPKSIDMVHMKEDYPDTGIALLRGHDYEVCTHLQIGYFVLLAGRLIFLPIDLKDHAYTVYQITKE